MNKKKLMITTTEQLHREFKTLCAGMGVSMNAHLISLMAEAVVGVKKGKKK